MAEPNDQAQVESAHYFALPKGTMLNEFRIEAVLGHGGFGITYRAVDTVLQEDVAIKEYFPNELAGRVATITVQAKSSGDTPDFQAGLASFLEEARLITRFRHPNIVHVRRFFEMHGTGYIVLDFERGETLGRRLERGALPEAELKELLTGLLAGLDAIHERAVLHRDLKPSNIILRESGSPVLIDFGAARDFRERHSRSITAIAAPGYSPPEQYGVGGEQGPWTDLYALGAVAYRCVTGTAPIDSLRRLRTDPLAPAAESAAAHYDASLLRTIDWMLQIEESDRPASVQQVRDALAQEIAAPRRAGVGFRAPMTWMLAAGALVVLSLSALAATNATFRQLVCDHVGLCTGPTTAEIRQREQAAEEARRRAEEEARLKQLEAARIAAEEARARAEQERLKIEAERAKALAEQKAAEEAKRKAEAEARQKAEEEARLAAEAKAKADAEAADKTNAEAAETALRLSLLDRQRLQVALTALGFDTSGSDGVFGPRSREAVAAWQRSRGEPATSFLTTAQRQALLRDGAGALAKFDEMQKKAEDDKKKAEDDKKKAEEAAARATPKPQPVGPPAPTPAMPSLAGKWWGTSNCPFALPYDLFLTETDPGQYTVKGSMGIRGWVSGQHVHLESQVLINHINWDGTIDSPTSMAGNIVQSLMNIHCQWQAHKK